MSSDNKTIQVGPGFAGTLFIVFLVLKLTHVIDWSWWWVTCPLWASFAILAVVMLGIMGIAAVAIIGTGIVAMAAAWLDARQVKRGRRRFNIPE